MLKSMLKIGGLRAKMPAPYSTTLATPLATLSPPGFPPLGRAAAILRLPVLQKKKKKEKKR